MRAVLFFRMLVLGAILTLPVSAYAQEAVFVGTVTDSTGGVVPGVTVTAVHTATGNTFFSVTDEQGIFRIPARIGAFRLTAELPGFATVTRDGLTLQVGQQVTVNLQMAPSGLQETVTVTGEAPLINTTQSVVGSNIDSRQMEELPSQGRQWASMALLAPGNRVTEASEDPGQHRSDTRDFQLNMDGLQVTANISPGGQPRYSQDSIAEFQFISNRFDATQGRSSGVQVNAVSKSGTNRFAGSFSTAFRNDQWNSPRFLTGLKNPLKEELYSGTFGGPVIQDKLHFFGNYQLERSPKSLVWETGYPAFDAASRDFTDTKKLGGLRLDYQMSSGTRMYLRGAVSKDRNLGGGGGGHPAAGTDNYRTTNDLILGVTSVLSNRTLNQVRVGYAGYAYSDTNFGFTPNLEANCFLDAARTQPCRIPNGIAGAPRITFSGFSVGGNQNGPRDNSQDIYTVRNDFTTSFNAKGRHDLKIGGEYLHGITASGSCRQCSTIVTANRFPLTSLPKTIDQYLGGGPGQDLYDSSTWDLNSLSHLVTRTSVGVGPFKMVFSRRVTGLWLQDDWAMTDRLTLNLGLRYDLIANAFANDVEFLPWLEGGRPNDNDNVQPRLGFAYQLNDKTVLRGGGGRYYGDTQTNMLSFTYSYSTIALIEYQNPAVGGSPTFFREPWGAQKPSQEEALARFCSNNGNQPGCLRRGAPELAPFPGDYAHIPNSYQVSAGVARQVSDVLAVEVDYIQTNTKNEKTLSANANVLYDPLTGANLPYTVIANRPYPDWGVVSYSPHGGWSDYRGLLMAFTKRFSQRWQASGNYLLSKMMDSRPNPISGTDIVTFDVAPDLGEDYGIAETDQRHRAVVNGIYNVGRGFQLSGLYFFGSGASQQIIPGTADVRDLGSNGDYPNRKRESGEIISRNTFKAPAIHRVDMRFQQRIPLGSRVRFDAQVEVFNLFNRFNPSGYETNEQNIRYGLPTESSNVAYAPRVFQFGFRTTF